MSVSDFERRESSRYRGLSFIAHLGRIARVKPRRKRVFDLAVVILLSPISLPVIFALYAIARLDGGPGFFGHERVGRHGAGFKCWKIRTMVVNADDSLKRHLASNPAAAQEWQSNFKLQNDPRITRAGRILRKTGLDELPQFWNVLLGEMSLVGPRPVSKEELGKYSDHVNVYLSMRPGITGLWQVSGRNDVTYDERVAIDVEYHKRATFMLDVKIVAKTALVMLKKTGV